MPSRAAQWSDASARRSPSPHAACCFALPHVRGGRCRRSGRRHRRRCRGGIAPRLRGGARGGPGPGRPPPPPAPRRGGGPGGPPAGGPPGTRGPGAGPADDPAGTAVVRLLGLHHGRQLPWNRAARVVVTNGAISTVSLVSSDGNPVAGKLSGDATSWASTQRLLPKTRYVATVAL